MSPDELELFFSEFGEPFSKKKLVNEEVERYRSKLPNALLKMWSQYGFCGFKNGLLWLVNPTDYEEVMDEWVGDTSIVEEDACYVIARNGFGDLYLWGENTGYNYKINTRMGWILPRRKGKKHIDSKRIDDAFGTFLAYKEAVEMDTKDNNNKYLFDRAVKKLGPLATDEMFGFEPALVAGGECKLENIVKVNIFTHLSILAQLGERSIMGPNELARATR